MNLDFVLLVCSKPWQTRVQMMSLKEDTFSGFSTSSLHVTDCQAGSAELFANFVDAATLVLEATLSVDDADCFTLAVNTTAA